MIIFDHTQQITKKKNNENENAYSIFRPPIFWRELSNIVQNIDMDPIGFFLNLNQQKGRNWSLFN